MSINLGSNPFGLYLGSTKIVEAYVGNVKVYSKGGFTPDIPSTNTTLRFKFENTSYTPTSGSGASSNITRTGMGTWSRVGSGTGIWDFNFSAAGTNGIYGFAFSSNKNTGAVDLIGANLTGMATNASTIRLASWATKYPNTKLRYIYGLTNVPAINNAVLECDNCTGLLKIGDIDLDGIATPSSITATNVNKIIFKGCTNLVSINSIKCSKIGTITFEECNALNHLNLSTNFDYTVYGSSYNPPYQGLLSAFKNCYKLDNALELFNKIKLSRAGKYMAYDTNTFLNAGSTSANNQLASIPDFIGGTLAGTVVDTYGPSVITSSPTNFNLTLHPGDIITTYGAAGSQGSNTGTISWSLSSTTSGADNQLYFYPSGGSGSRAGTQVIMKTGLGFNSSYTNTANLRVSWTSSRPTFSYSITRYNF